MKTNSITLLTLLSWAVCSLAPLCAQQLPFDSSSAQDECCGEQLSFDNRGMASLEEVPFCYTRSYHDKLKELDERHEQRVRAINAAIYEQLTEWSIPSRSANPSYTIPVVIHIVSPPGTPLGIGSNLTDADILRGLEILNAAFANQSFFETETGVDIGVSFCLAKQAPDGTPTTGITRTESTLVDDGSCYGPGTDVQNANSVKALINWDCSRYLNIWLVTDLYNESFGCSLAGFATFPGTACVYDGIFQEARYWKTQAGAKVTAHEAGHYLGLYHTFFGGCDNDNCLTDGDKVCDTPPDNSPAFASCSANSCNTDTPDLIDDSRNYMDYTSCTPWHFTLGQKERMIAALENGRSEILQSNACQGGADTDIWLLDLKGQLCQSAVCPEVLVSNNGSTPITSIEFEYGPAAVSTSYLWSGTILPNDTAYINLPCLSLAEGTFEFSVSATEVNGLPDDYAANNLKTFSLSIDPITAEFQVVSFNGTKKAFFPETEGAFHYAWDFGDGDTSNEERPVHTYLTPGDYVITLTIIDACGDSTSATQEIEIDGCQPGWRGQIRSLNNYVEPDEDICDFVQDGVMHLPSSFSDINYYWTNFNFCDTICIPENFTFQVRLKNAQQDGGLNAYDIRVSLTGEGLNTGLQAMGASWALQYTRIWSGDTQLNDLPELIFDFSEFFILEMEFSNGVVYFKYNGTVFKELPAQEAICDIRNIRFYFKGSGMVDWLKVADEGGEVIFEENFDDCQNMEEPEICTPAPFLVDFDQQLGCELGELVINPLSGDGPFVYNLVPNPNDISTSDSIFTDLPPASYTATAAAVCSYQDSSIQFSIPEPLRDSIVFQEAAICGGLGQIVISGIDGVPPYGYKLNDGDWQDSGTFTGLAPGTYQMTVKDQRGCESTRAVEITSQVSEIQLDVDSTDLSWSCLDQNAFISFSAQGDALYHFFQLDDRPPQADGLFTDLTPGLYTALAIDENNCYSEPYEFEVTEEYINFPNVQEFIICEGDSVVVGNQVYSQAGTYLDTLASVQGCDSTVTTELTVNASYNLNLQSTICQTDTLFFNGQPLTEEGTYTAEYQTTQGCDSTVELQLTVLPEFETPVSATICEGETYPFNGQELNAAGTYEAELQSQAGCDSLVVLQLSVAALSETFFDTTLCEGAVLELSGQAFDAAGDYTLQLADANGCDSTVYLMLDYYPPPLYEVETTPDFGYGDGSLSLALADSTHTLIWEDGSTDPERTSLPAGFYYASIEDEWGCVAEIEVEVPGGELRLAMPNTFTPNGDGTNDFFSVVGNAEAEVAAFRIFNRWGQQVYNNEYPTRGWDGTANGKPQPAEVYYYQIEVQTPDGVWTRQGDVTLVR